MPILLDTNLYFFAMRSDDGAAFFERRFLPLAFQTTAPAPITTSFVVANDRPTVRQVLHPDAFNTPYVVLTFPGGSLASLDGTSLGPGDSVTIVIRPEVGLYGFTLSPRGLTFALVGQEWNACCDPGPASTIPTPARQT